jgi:hypothetical protein
LKLLNIPLGEQQEVPREMTITHPPVMIERMVIVSLAISPPSMDHTCSVASPEPGQDPPYDPIFLVGSAPYFSEYAFL